MSERCDYAPAQRTVRRPPARGVLWRSAATARLAVAARPARAARWILAALLALAAAAALGSLLAAGGCARTQPNHVAAFLDGAERQTETAEHRREVQQALSDMLGLPPHELAQRRYRDYEGTPGAWTVIQLLERSFVPEQPAVLDSAAFYRDVRRPAARAAIQRQLTAVEHALAEDPDAPDVP